MDTKTQNAIELISAAQTRVKEAETAYTKQFYLLKKHHNEVYQPMYEEKKRLAKVLEDEQKALSAILAENLALVEAIKGLKIKVK